VWAEAENGERNKRSPTIVGVERGVTRDSLESIVAC
jgi:hypothetical protein